MILKEFVHKNRSKIIIILNILVIVCLIYNIINGFYSNQIHFLNITISFLIIAIVVSIIIIKGLQIVLRKFEHKIIICILCVILSFFVFLSVQNIFESVIPNQTTSIRDYNRVAEIMMLKKTLTSQVGWVDFFPSEIPTFAQNVSFEAKVGDSAKLEFFADSGYINSIISKYKNIEGIEIQNNGTSYTRIILYSIQPAGRGGTGFALDYGTPVEAYWQIIIQDNMITFEVTPNLAE